jgi:hypothetical protein
MMARRMIFLVACLCIATAAFGQRVTRTFNDVSMSEALRWLNEQGSEYNISFLYNELEDFRVTTSVKNKSVPDAIQQLIGFYPIKMTVQGKDIAVECPQKASTRYKGTVLDETGQPLPYANVALLSPRDSTLITGGVTNESGLFVIPCDQSGVLARITYVGYRPVYRHCKTPHLGTIKMQPDQYTLGSVTVKGERPQYQMTTGGMTVNVAGTVLSDMGTGIDVLGQLPRVDVKGDGQVSIFGSGTPLIYINNRPIQSNTELSRLKSGDIKSIDVITSPGARYKKNVSSVIRIYTVKPQGDGFSVSTITNVRNNHEWGGYQDIDVKYRTHGLELFAECYWRSAWMGEDNNISNELFLNDGTVHVDQTGDTKYRSKSHYEKLGFNYDVGENHSLGASYTLSGVNIKNSSVIGEQQIWNNGMLEGSVWYDALVNRKQNPLHDVNMYYVGKVGQLSIDFNGTWYCRNERNTDERTELSDGLDDRHVLTQSRQRNQMTAGKLILSHPLWKGSASIGTELTFTRTDGTYSNDDQSHLSSDTRIRESNSAGFAEYDFTVGNFTLGAGLRFEHINSDYYSSGIREEEPSRTYNDWFPNASVTWKKDKWNWQLNYSRRINRPSYFQLRNFIQYDNRYTYEGGNPLLRPQLNHRLELSAIYSWLSLQVRYTYSQSTMCWVPVLEQDKRYILLCTRNYGDAQRLFASLVVAPRFGVYRPTVTLSFNKVFFDAEQYGSHLTHHRPLWRFELRNTFVLGHSWTAVLGVRFASDADDEFQSVKHYWTIGARINKSFFNKALKVNLYADDIFKTSQERWTTYGIGTNITKDCYNFDRTIGLTVTYNFNVTRSKYKGTGAGNDEKSRL